MCGPMAIGITTLAIGVISSVASYAQNEAQAQAQSAYQEAQAEQYLKAANQNNKAAQIEYVEKSAAERIGQMQEQKAAAEKVQDQQKERLRNQGTMIASSNAAGVAFDQLMGEYERQEANNKQRIREQYLNTAVNSELNLASFKRQTENRINSQQDYVYMDSSASASTYNAIGLGLGIAGAGLSGFNAYTDAQNKAGKEPTKVYNQPRQ